MRLSPFADFERVELVDGAIVHGVCHRLSGWVFGISDSFRQILACLRDSALDTDDLAQLEAAPDAVKAIDCFREHHILISSDRPDEILAPFRDWRLVLPVRNPGFGYRDESGCHLVRLRETQVCTLPRSALPPAIVHETISRAAFSALRAALNGQTLGELGESTEIFATLHELCSPDRQMVRAMPPGADPADFNSAAHYLTQSVKRRSVNEPALSADLYYQSNIQNAEWNFDWLEPTVCHSFRRKTAALGDQTYGERFCDSVLRILPRDSSLGELRVLEIGAGTGIFARDFFHRATEKLEIPIAYTIVDCSPALLESQRETLGSRIPAVRFIRQDARALSIPGETFDVIVCNEVVADLPAVRDPTDGSWCFAALLAFLDRVVAHLADAGIAFISEYGDRDQCPRLAEHLNHTEVGIDFGSVMSHCVQHRIPARIEELSRFLNIRGQAEMLCAQQEHHHCLNQFLRTRGRELQYAAYDRAQAEKECDELLNEHQGAGVAFAPIAKGLHFGPDLSHFYVLALRKPR